MDHMIPVEGRH